MPINRRYVLITPCRNEAQFAQRTLDSVIGQSIRPALWVIVDDGSSDGTTDILAKFAEQHDFITILRRTDRGKRSVGPGVIEAFYTGYNTIHPDDYDYLCKFDLDLDLPQHYFETLIERMEENPRIGTCSGKPYYFDKKSGCLVSEKCGDEMSVGMTKFYRMECFQKIGGFVRQVMWDGIDCHRCRLFGWIAVSWDEPELRFIHLRPMGSSQQSLWSGRVRWGYGQYFMGTGSMYILVSALYRMLHPPVLIGGLGILWGYLKSALAKAPRYEDSEFRQFLRNYQKQCLLLGKGKATQRLNEQQAAAWQPQSSTSTQENSKQIKDQSCV